jgi:hypothetical protein
MKSDSFVGSLPDSFTACVMLAKDPIGKISEINHAHRIITSPAFYGFPFATSKKYIRKGQQQEAGGDEGHRNRAPRDWSSLTTAAHDSGV